MADEQKPDKRLEEEALAEVGRVGVMQDAFMQWEEMQFTVLAPGGFEALKPVRTYAVVIMMHPILSNEAKVEVLTKSDEKKVSEHDALAREFNGDLAMIKLLGDRDRLMRYVENARAIRARPL